MWRLMAQVRDTLQLAADAIRAHKLRASLTILGLTMGVATLVTVMTIVQGANVCVEQKIANLGTNVFRVAKLHFAVVDFDLLIKAQKNKRLEYADYVAVNESCTACGQVGASASGTLTIVYGNKQADDVNIIGYTPNIIDVDTRTPAEGRYFTPREDQRAAVDPLSCSRL